MILGEPRAGKAAVFWPSQLGVGMLSLVQRSFLSLANRDERS